MKPTSRLRWSARLGALAAVVAVTSAVGLAVATPAQAATQIPCPSDIGTLGGTPASGTQAEQTDGIVIFPRRVYRFTVVSATPTFFVSDARIVINNLDSPASATLTSQVSQTISVSATLGSTVKLTEKLQQTVNFTIQSQRTTSIGVNVSFTVPPHSSVLGQYGVQGYSVIYDVQLIYWTWWTTPQSCADGGTQRASTNAPTSTEGWQLSSA